MYPDDEEKEKEKEKREWEWEWEGRVVNILCWQQSISVFERICISIGSWKRNVAVIENNDSTSWIAADETELQ